MSDIALRGMISGLALGALYAIFALSIVLLYRTANLINFAQGNMAAFLAFIANSVIASTLALSLGLSALMTVAIGALLGIAVQFLVIYPKRGTERDDLDVHLNLLFRTMGLMLFLFALMKLIWGRFEPYRFPSIFGEGSVDIAGFRVSYLEIGAVLTATVLASAFGALIKYTRAGLMIRAVASDRGVARLLGVRVVAVETLSWAIAGALAAVVGMMFAAQYSLYSEVMEPFLFKAFTAALLGGLSSFGGAIVGGLLIGVIDAELALFATTELRTIASLAIMIGVLLIRPNGLFGRERPERV